MAATYVLISAQTLGGNAASVTFSSIPSTYTDLVLMMSARHTSTSPRFDLYFSSGGSGLYSNTYLISNYKSNSIPSSVRVGTRSQMDSYCVTSSDTTATYFGNAEIYIPGYNTSEYKPISMHAVTETNANPATDGQAIDAGMLRAGALNSITIGIGDYITNSTFYLYGIKNS